MEDKRLVWMKSRLYIALDLSDEELFLSLMKRDAGKVEKQLLKFMDQSSEQYPPAIIFYCIQHEVEEMVEVVEGMCYSVVLQEASLG